MKTKTYVEVRSEFPGLHHWPDAPEAQRFLRSSHRHMFQVRVRVEVFSNERQVEFFDLLGEVYAVLGRMVGDLGAKSCETIAHTVLSAMMQLYSEHREYEVEVSEDGENGAVVIWV